MTNEEAIEKLEHYRYCLKFQYGWYGKDDDEAIDMAIKALEQTDGDLTLPPFESGGVIQSQIHYPIGSNYSKEKIGEKQTDGDLITEIDKLPRIKVGNSNSPTVKYCIDEVLPYDLLEHYKAEKTAEQSYSWCKGCKEYDTEKHCCHRYSSFIRESLQENINAVLEDIKAEINEIDSMTFVGSGSGCASEMQTECLKILNKHISGKEQ